MNKAFKRYCFDEELQRGEKRMINNFNCVFNDAIKRIIFMQYEFKYYYSLGSKNKEHEFHLHTQKNIGILLWTQRCHWKRLFQSCLQRSL